jgi:hypothetical protein
MRCVQGPSKQFLLSVTGLGPGVQWGTLSVSILCGAVCQVPQ